MQSGIQGLTKRAPLDFFSKLLEVRRSIPMTTDTHNPSAACNRGHQKRLLRSRRVVTPQGLVAADILIENGTIAQVADIGSTNAEALDLEAAVVGPGVIDVHCHINEPGRADWEGFRTATRAAAAGGITLLCDMPLNSEPVTSTAQAFERKVAAASGQLHIDVALYGGVIPSNAADEQALAELSRAGAAAFKCFLCDSGLKSFPAVAREHLASAMPQIAQLGKRLLAHAELFDAQPPSSVDLSTPRSYEETLAARPSDMELRAIDLLSELCEATGCAVHIVHLSAAAALPRLQALRAAGLPITVETCPHYLTFCAEELELDPVFKCTPPIRDRCNREALWQGLKDGIIDFVATDHSPCPADLKFPAGPDSPASQQAAAWTRAWGGIASLQLLLPALWTQAQSRGFSVEDVSSWLASRPASWLGCHDRGSIEPGKRADLVVWDPDRSFVVDAYRLLHRHPITPYHGRTLSGIVDTTIAAGQTVFDRNSEPPLAGAQGRILRLRGPNTGSANGSASDTAELDRLSVSKQRLALEHCCGSSQWVKLVGAQAPFRTVEHLHRTAEHAFDQLADADWLEAFAAHPRIGNIDSLKKKYAATKLRASQEQAGTVTASERTLAQLAKANHAYETKFGHVFLVCATGRTAEAMLTNLETRLSNEAAREFAIAAEEQRKITFLRLQSLVEEAPAPSQDATSTMTT